ncbi:MAG TPA: flagellar biosynthesis anti-sigma factor FlgM [Bryobacteraceae bacterium]|nr:flagellar biosynthesis anti-sigma factor FlgM [Bryobacteraceae bacterium]
MRADDLNRTAVRRGAQQAEETSEKRASEKSGDLQAASGDQANVSSLARALSSRDAQKLEQLRLEVQSGKYNVPAGEIANSIISSHLKD